MKKEAGKENAEDFLKHYFIIPFLHVCNETVYRSQNLPLSRNHSSEINIYTLVYTK